MTIFLLQHKISIKMIWLGIITAPWIYYVEKYIFNDWSLLVSLGMLVVLDTFFGIWKALKKRDVEKEGFTKKGFSKIIPKLAIYAGWLILMGVLEKASVLGKQNIVMDWIHTGAVSILLMREAISVGENLLAIRPDGKLKKLVDRMNKFFDMEEKTGDDKKN